MTKDYLDVTGRIFDIQKFSVHDGPGIRTLIFLKGCFFNCQWCCNPESQNFGIEEMIVNGEAEIIGRDVTVGEVIKTIEQDRPYYRRSGGGITLSGGEALSQPEFAKALLTACNDRGISTAIESTAGVDSSIVKDILPTIDYFLLDIKHMDGEKHKRFTGQDNKIILENAKLIASSSAQLMIRVPVIVGFNDSLEEIREIAKFASTLPGVKKLFLLPYHAMGQDKYVGLGRPYLLEGLVPPTEAHMQKLVKVVSECGLEVQIGG